MSSYRSNTHQVDRPARDAVSPSRWPPRQPSPQPCTVGPAALTLSRAVANVPVSAAAVAWGRAHDGDCDLHRDLTVSCASMHGGYTNAGTTVGNVWLYGDLDGSDRHRHESRHSDQWSMFGPAFPAWYGAESARTHGDFHRNVFERWAGLHDGGYREH